MQNGGYISQDVYEISKKPTVNDMKTKKLFRNREFRLIHVPNEVDKGAQPMTIVTPALNYYIYNEVLRDGYYTLSHVWGPEEEWETWRGHGITGTNGKTVEAKVRPKKQNVILRLLLSHPGFWWIDVFCAQTKTPPSIMGYIYRFCRKCYALVDFRSTEFSRVEAVSRRLATVGSVDCIANAYKKRIHGRMSSASQTWHESLDDLLGGWYDGDPDDVKALADFLSCRWFTRVWTLQEYALPRILIFMSESDSEFRRLARGCMIPFTDVLRRVAYEVFLRYMRSATHEEYLYHYDSVTREEHEYASSTPGLSRCYLDLRRFDAIDIFNDFCSWGRFSEDSTSSLGFDVSNSTNLVLLLKKFARLPRTCMYPRDYIYGVAGLLDLDIPFEEDDEDVWDHFRMAVLKRAPYLKIPETFPLSNTMSMQDVYKMFSSVDTRPTFNAIQAMENMSL
ncbi:hypothetical protein BX666DRAFT_895962 [Dichotomocladium elegans]|nr:hypothetical protein BX666DRAFT_895962 [Dichotomocladium elegans]